MRSVMVVGLNADLESVLSVISGLRQSQLIEQCLPREIDLIVMGSAAVAIHQRLSSQRCGAVFRGDLGDLQLGHPQDLWIEQVNDLDLWTNPELPRLDIPVRKMFRVDDDVVLSVYKEARQTVENSYNGLLLPSPYFLRERYALHHEQALNVEKRRKYALRISQLDRVMACYANARQTTAENHPGYKSLEVEMQTNNEKLTDITHEHWQYGRHATVYTKHHVYMGTCNTDWTFTSATR